MASRSLWSGAIGFGMVNIPVKMYTATNSKGISFHLLHEKCKTRIQEMRYCPNCDEKVSWDELERGYEYSKGRYVVLSGEDFEQLPLPSKNIVQISSFVKLEELDPVFFEKSYYLEPERTGTHPFQLFMQVLNDKGMVGIGTVTIRSKERLCALRPRYGTILLTTLLYPDEVSIDLNAESPNFKLPQQELSMASSLLDLLAQPFNPEQYHDHYRDALTKLIDAKLEGVELEEKAKPVRTGEVVDLMAALQASIGKLKGQSPSERVETEKAEAKEKVSEASASASQKSRKTSKKSAGTGAAAKKSRSKRGAA